MPMFNYYWVFASESECFYLKKSDEYTWQVFQVLIYRSIVVLHFQNNADYCLKAKKCVQMWDNLLEFNRENRPD